jgi:endonuclease I
MADVMAGDLRTSMAELAEARERPYYDAEADRSAVDVYYASAALHQLGDLVRSTHTAEPRYKPARELYPWVDLQPDGKLRSLYTAQIFEPEDLIQADFEILRARAAKLMRATAQGERDLGRAEAEAEAELPFNCEHVVPQSWFGKAEPMRGDLHDLFACESRCNGFRGNTPFAEFPDFPEPSPPGGVGAMHAVRGDCGKSESGGFEPTNGKGAAARAVFYFRLRYPGEISVLHMPDSRWEMAVTWHEQDPVTIWERHRNAAIFERQGNRNPFIDHPEWLSEVAANPPG